MLRRREAGDSAAVVYQTDRLYRLDIKPIQGDDGPSASYYVSFLKNCLAGSSVFCPQEERGGYDSVIFIRPTRVQLYTEQLPGGYGDPMSVEDYFPEKTRWVLPYDYRAFYSATTAPAVWSSQFYARAPGPGAGPNSLPVTLHASTGADWRLRPGHVWNWSASDVSAIDFGSTGSLTLGGQMTVTGVALSARDGQGWKGLSVPGGSLTLGAGTSVSAVTSPTAAVTVSSGGSATLDGTTIQNTAGGGAGILVTGKGSSAHLAATSLTLPTFVRGTTSGPAVLATGGGSAIIDGNNVRITGNAGGGVAATGTGSSVLITAAQVRDNLGSAVRASGGGRVDVLRYTGYIRPTTLNLPVTLDNNQGGLYAVAAGKTGGGVINTGEHIYECTPDGCPDPSVGDHNITNNNPNHASGAPFDISARGGSGVAATENYWGPAASAYDSTAVERDKDSQSYIAYLPLRTTPASLTGAPASARSASPGASLSAVAMGDETGAARVSLGVLALLGEAEARTQAGDSTAAAERILSAWALSGNDDDRTAVAEAAGRTLAVLEPADLIAWTGTTGVWGARARAAGLIGQERYSEATASADLLASDTGTSETALGHRARGLSLLVEAAVGSGDASSAMSSLAALAAIDPEGAADLSLSVAVAFPEAPITLARGTVEGGSNTAAGKTAPEAPSVSLTAGPNPSSGTVRVSLALDAPSTAMLAVFDALGRQVAVLHEGAASGTVEASFDGHTLPAGVYVIRAVVRGANGTSVLTRTLTVAR